MILCGVTKAEQAFVARFLTAIRSGTECKTQSIPRLGGLHHRYAVAA